MAKVVPYFILLLGFIYFGLGPHFVPFYHFPLDDAWIHRVYSRSLSLGHGFAYSGMLEAGETSPLWAIVTVPAEWIGILDKSLVVPSVKLLTLLFAFGCLWLLYGIFLQISDKAKFAFLPPLLFALEPKFLFSIHSGMENILVVFLWLVVTYLVTTGRWGLSAVFASLVPLARPEGVLILAAWDVAILVFRKRFEYSLGVLVSYIVLSLIPSALWSTYCYSVNGHLLPNTFYAKASLNALTYGNMVATGEIFFQFGWSSSPVLVLIVVAWCIASFMPALKPVSYRLRPAVFFLALAPVVYIGAVAFTRPLDPRGYYWIRWLEPPILVLTGCFSIGVVHFILMLLKWDESSKKGSILSGKVLAFCILAGLAIHIPSLAYSTIERKWRLYTDSKATYEIAYKTGEWLSRNTSPDDEIGIIHAGAVGYLSGRKVYDIFGLNNHQLLFKEMSYSDLLKRIEWIEAYPVVYNQLDRTRNFEPVISFGVSPEEYTICPCPSQVRNFIYKKKQTLLQQN
ncbi:MAG: hypothetical protein D6808_01035 [Candidatus Dadabacteria bacterium]|nr:MAG: hypothetical protein D6808_01035 [Candidatus Dadabacteria bacterium]